MKKFANITLCAATVLSIATGIFETTSAHAESQEVGTTLTSSETPEGVRVFELGTITNPVTYTAGEEVFYEGKIYKVLQTHQNHGENWTPDATPTLFMYVRTPEEPSTPPTETAKQTLELGGPGLVNGDATHQEGFARLRVKMTDGVLKLAKNSQYNFNEEYKGKKYASVTVKDEKGTVLYDKTWNGDQSITDLPNGKYGDFASYELKDGSTVTIYHAEGTTGRFNTSENEVLKEQAGTAYNYVVKEGQLILVKEEKPTPPEEIPDLNGKTVNIVSGLNNSVLEYRDNGKELDERICIGNKNGTNGDLSQQWTFVRVSSEQGRYNELGCNKDTYYIYNNSITNEDKYLFQNADKRSVFLISSLYMNFETTWWRVEKTDINGVYRIASPLWKTVLDVSDDGASVGQNGTKTNQPDQQWRINIVK